MPLTLGTTDQTTFSQVASLQNMIQMGTGSADAGSAERATSSGMSMAQSASIKRQKRTLMNFQNTFLIPMINKSMWRKIQFDVERYPATDYKFVPYSTMGIMAKELEMTQMVQMLQAIPKDSPAFNVILLSMIGNSSMHDRDKITSALTQGNQPNPEQQQMQQMGTQLQMEEMKAKITKLYAEAEEEKAKAIKWQAEAANLQPNEIDIQEKVLKLQKDSIGLQKTQADINSKNMDTERTYPEVDHLRSETALNMANARKIAQETLISGVYQ
jgi:hypothetical protein